MYSISRTGEYEPKKFIVDLVSDVNTLPTKGIPPGSTAFVIENSTSYMLNNQRRWIKVNLSNGSGGSSGGGGYDEVIYDGGVLEETTP